MPSAAEEGAGARWEVLRSSGVHTVSGLTSSRAALRLHLGSPSVSRGLSLHVMSQLEGPHQMGHLDVTRPSLQTRELNELSLLPSLWYSALAAEPGVDNTPLAEFHKATERNLGTGLPSALLKHGDRDRGPEPLTGISVSGLPVLLAAGEVTGSAAGRG